MPLTDAQIKHTTGPYPTNMRRNITQGVPGLGVWYQTGRTEQDPNHWSETHIGLFSIVPRSGEGIFEAQRNFAKIAAELDMPPSPFTAVGTPVNWYQFTFIMGSGFGLARDYTPEGKKKQAEYLLRLLEANARMGYGEYRAPPLLQDAVAAQYSFNNHALRRFNETLKDAVDPNGILSPGRAGIWPHKYRSLKGGHEG